MLVVVLCGHGQELEVPDPATKLFVAQPMFAGHDGKKANAATLVRLNGLIGGAEEHGCTTLFLVDACRDNGEPNRGTRGGIQGKKVTLPKNMAILFACAQGQLSHQSDTAVGKHGVFTSAVLKTLKAEAAAGDASWSGLVSGVNKAFRSPEVRGLLPPGTAQTPVLATGEMADIELFAIDPISADYAQLEANRLRGQDGQYLTRVAADRLPIWQKAAETANPSAQVLYACCLVDGIGVKRDDVAAVKWFRKAADAGHPLAMCLLGAMYLEGRGGLAKDEATAVGWVRKAANAGEPLGMFFFGLAYERGGAGLAKDEVEAVQWYRKAAAVNSKHAKASLKRLGKE